MHEFGIKYIIIFLFPFFGGCFFGVSCDYRYSSQRQGFAISSCALLDGWRFDGHDEDVCGTFFPLLSSSSHTWSFLYSCIHLFLSLSCRLIMYMLWRCLVVCFTIHLSIYPSPSPSLLPYSLLYPPTLLLLLFTHQPLKTQPKYPSPNIQSSHQTIYRLFIYSRCDGCLGDTIRWSCAENPKVWLSSRGEKMQYY